MIWGKPQNQKRSLVISHFDGTKFDVIAPKQMEPFFGFPQKVKRNEQYEKTNSLGDGSSNVL